MNTGTIAVAEPRPHLNGKVVAGPLIEPEVSEDGVFFPWLTPEVVADSVATMAELTLEQMALTIETAKLNANAEAVGSSPIESVQTAPKPCRPRCSSCRVTLGRAHKPDCTRNAEKDRCSECNAVWRGRHDPSCTLRKGAPKPQRTCPSCGVAYRRPHLETCPKSKSFKGTSMPEPKIKMVPLKPDPESDRIQGSGGIPPLGIVPSFVDPINSPDRDKVDGFPGYHAEVGPAVPLPRQRELAAMEAIAGELDGLEWEARQRVLVWVKSVHGMV